MMNLRSGWQNVARRMQQISGKQSGYSFVRISVLVDRNGDPVFWFEPQLTRIEPAEKAAEFMAQLLEAETRRGT